jgi:hypothetical protein
MPDRPEINSGRQFGFNPQHRADTGLELAPDRRMPFFSASAAFTAANLSALLSLGDGRPK